jgi:hypothetical protein
LLQFQDAHIRKVNLSIIESRCPAASSGRTFVMVLGAAIFASDIEALDIKLTLGLDKPCPLNARRNLPT